MKPPAQSWSGTYILSAQQRRHDTYRMQVCSIIRKNDIKQMKGDHYVLWSDWPRRSVGHGQDVGAGHAGDGCCALLCSLGHPSVLQGPCGSALVHLPSRLCVTKAAGTVKELGQG